MSLNSVQKRFSKLKPGREAVDQAGTGLPRAWGLINARFHAVSSFWPRFAFRLARETLSRESRLGGPLHYRAPKQRSIDGYRERFWCIVQPFQRRPALLPMASRDPPAGGHLINDVEPYADIFR